MANNNRLINEVLLEIYQYLYQKQYQKAENKLLDFIKRILSKKNLNSEKKKYLTLINTIYNQLNSNYLIWVKTMKAEIKNEIKKLSSKKHDNFLLAHSHDPSCLDDLLKEVENYLKNPNNLKIKKTAIYYFNCYKNLLPD